MAEFNAMDTAAFKGVWVFCEQREGEIQSISYQLLSEGRKLANDLGVELAGVVMGSGLAEADLKTLGGYGADRVYNIDSPLLKFLYFSTSTSRWVQSAVRPVCRRAAQRGPRSRPRLVAPISMISGFLSMMRSHSALA